MGTEIRIASPEDAPAACAVLRTSIEQCCVQDHKNAPQILDAWLGNKTAQNVASWIASPSNYTLVAERDGEIVGVALLTQAGKLSLCYVLPAVLHSGAGKALLAEVEAQARRWDISVLRLHSTASARAFYLRHGYLDAGKERSCYGVECDFFWKKLTPDAAPTDEQARKRYCGCGGQ
ncbi:GNAT family N-acetyltransferase [Massilia glaciei]|uniref:GNAT family N-acetyltransferase n=1 Tax=Massilia glaciei TaxID=1524097 RepID=A0A2U2HDX4_9BURK|nr:GNAT family N-acetyltransferase [Massilia glaciei]PWF41532.1 GNAT family N-acetyltransferase [Massilia glaciei]